MFDTLVLALLPAFVVMLLGYAAGRIGRMGGDSLGVLNKLVMEFTLPAALFVGTATAPLSQTLQQAPAFPVLGIAMVVPFAAWYAFERRRGRDSGDAAVLALTVALPNFAAAGLPIVAAVAGEKGGSFIALTIAAGAMIPSPLALVLLELSRPGAPEGGSVFGRVAKAVLRACAKPIVWAPAVGVTLAIAGVTLPAALLASFKLIGQATAGVALFLTGLVISLQRFRLSAGVVLAVVVTNVVQPLFCLAILLPLHLPWEVARLTILCCAMPAGFFGILFAIGYKRSSADAGSIVLASTVASAATLAIAMALLFPA